MGTFHQFEEIDAWRTARELARWVYDLTEHESLARDYGLKDQMRRASVGIMSNIAEGFERDGTREFIQFLSIAKGSAGELKSQLYVALDQGYITQSEFNKGRNLLNDTTSLIAGLMNYLKQSGKRGSKYR